MKKVVKTTYACGICDDEYDKPEDALECEKKGVAIPEFKQFEVVKIIDFKFGLLLKASSGFKTPFWTGIKAVVHNNPARSWPNPHLLPYAYEIWISTLGGPYKKELISIPRKHLKRVRIRGGLICPLCESVASPANKTGFYNFFSFGSKLPHLINISMRRCQECNVEFFTDDQSLKVETTLRKKIKWPIANTRTLIRESAFQY